MKLNSIQFDTHTLSLDFKKEMRQAIRKKKHREEMSTAVTIMLVSVCLN